MRIGFGRLYLTWGAVVVVACGLLSLVPTDGIETVEATAVSVPQFAGATGVTARPVVVTAPDVVSAELVASGKVDAAGAAVMWLAVVRVVPSNEIDLVSGLPKPDRAIREVYSGPWGQGVVLERRDEGVRYPDTVVPGEIVFEAEASR